MIPSTRRSKSLRILALLACPILLPVPSHAVEVLLSGFETDLSTSIPGVSWSPQPTVSTQIASGIPGTSEGTHVLQIQHPEIWNANNTPWIQLNGQDVARAISESTALKFDLIAPQDFAWRQAFVVVQGSPISWTQTQFNLAAPPDTAFTVEFSLTQSFQDSQGMTRPLNQIALNAFDQETDWFQLIIAFQGQENLPLGTSTTYLDNLRLVQPDTPEIDGDYNSNGIVDAADYTVWRDHLGQTFALDNERPDAATPGVVDVEDYAFWKVNFGAGGGSGATVAVPEPATLFLAAIMLMSLNILNARPSTRK